MEAYKISRIEKGGAYKFVTQYDSRTEQSKEEAGEGSYLAYQRDFT